MRLIVVQEVLNHQATAKTAVVVPNASSVVDGLAMMSVLD
jgi:hypothetical protein